jgi:hypothetical protein
MEKTKKAHKNLEVLSYNAVSFKKIPDFIKHLYTDLTAKTPPKQIGTMI